LAWRRDRQVVCLTGFARITGYTLEEIQASDFSGRVHPADVALVELARDLNLRGQGTRIEYRYRCKSGEYVWLDTQATPVAGASGSVERIVLTTREITLRKAAERDLRRLEAHWRALLCSAPDIVELLDIEGTVLFAKRPRPGRDQDDVIGSKLTRDLSREAGHIFRQALRQALATGQPVDVQWEWSPAGQCATWYWSRIAPLAGAEASERLVMLSRDVTERKRQAQDQEALPAAVRATSQQLAGQLVAALDRLTAAGAALTPGSAADAALEHAQDAIRGAASLAGRLAALAGPAAETTTHAAVPIAEAQAAAARPARLLLVDDDDSVRASLLALLRARGARVVAAADGQAAIDLFALQAEEIDAVVLDQNMPAMNGSSVLRELRAIRPDIKVVISSGDLMESWDTQLDECNRLAFAQKALGPQELITQLQRLLGRKL
jgi:PAS domain S-box-containing protein